MEPLSLKTTHNHMPASTAPTLPYAMNRSRQDGRGCSPEICNMLPKYIHHLAVPGQDSQHAWPHGNQELIYASILETLNPKFKPSRWPAS